MFANLIKKAAGLLACKNNSSLILLPTCSSFAPTEQFEIGTVVCLLTFTLLSNLTDLLPYAITITSSFVATYFCPCSEVVSDLSQFLPWFSFPLTRTNLRAKFCASKIRSFFVRVVNIVRRIILLRRQIYASRAYRQHVRFITLRSAIIFQRFFASNHLIVTSLPLPEVLLPFLAFLPLGLITLSYLLPPFWGQSRYNRLVASAGRFLPLIIYRNGNLLLDVVFSCPYFSIYRIWTEPELLHGAVHFSKELYPNLTFRFSDLAFIAQNNTTRAGIQDSLHLLAKDLLVVTWQTQLSAFAYKALTFVSFAATNAFVNLSVGYLLGGWKSASTASLVKASEDRLDATISSSQRDVATSVSNLQKGLKADISQLGVSTGTALQQLHDGTVIRGEQSTAALLVNTNALTTLSARTSTFASTQNNLITAINASTSTVDDLTRQTNALTDAYDGLDTNVRETAAALVVLTAQVTENSNIASSDSRIVHGAVDERREDVTQLISSVRVNSSVTRAASTEISQNTATLTTLTTRVSTLETLRSQAATP